MWLILYLTHGFQFSIATFSVCDSVLWDLWDYLKSFRWWFQKFYFHSYLGKIPILTNIFQMGWNHQLVMFKRVPADFWKQFYMVIHRFPTQPRSQNKTRGCYSHNKTRSIHGWFMDFFLNGNELWKKREIGKGICWKYMNNIIKIQVENIRKHLITTKNVTLRDLRSWKIDGT